MSDVREILRPYKWYNLEFIICDHIKTRTIFSLCYIRIHCHQRLSLYKWRDKTCELFGYMYGGRELQLANLSVGWAWLEPLESWLGVRMGMGCPHKSWSMGLTVAFVVVYLIFLFTFPELYKGRKEQLIFFSPRTQTRKK